MKLYYFKDKNGNFGDDLNAFLWERLLPHQWDVDDGIRVSGIGTIISRSMPAAKHWIIMGSGAGYKPAPASLACKGWHVLCVRGPLTAAALNLPPETAVTDAAILLAQLPEYAPVPTDQRKGIVFMPHRSSLKYGRWHDVCAAAGITFLDPRADAKETLRRIQHAELVLADAMHAAIAADTLRVPWVPLTTSSAINSFKWLDWTLSMHVPYRPIDLPPSSRAEKMHSILGDFFSGYRLPVLTAEAALAFYRHAFSFPVFLSARLSRITIRLIAHICASLYKTEDDQPFIKEATRALQAATKNQSFLSDDAIFKTRQAAMVDRVSTLKALMKHL